MKYAAFISIVGVLICSCQCLYIKCAGSNYYGQFRIVRTTDGADLVFGPTKIYDKTQIRFYALRGSDTTFFEYQTIKFPNTGYDSILYVNFFPKTDVAYMELSNGDIDTLNITTITYDTKCCGTSTEITNFRFNNSVDIPGNNGTQEIRK